MKNEGDIKLPKDVWCFFDSDQVDLLYWSTILKEFDGLTTFNTCYFKTCILKPVTLKGTKGKYHMVTSKLIKLHMKV